MDGREFHLKPLNDAAYGELELWVRGNFLQSVNMSLLEEKDEAKKAAEKKEAYEFSLLIEWDSEVGRKALTQTKSGQARMLYQSLVPTTRRITQAICSKLLENEENLSAFWDAFAIANDLDKNLDRKPQDDSGEKKSGEKSDSDTTKPSEIEDTESTKSQS